MPEPPDGTALTYRELDDLSLRVQLVGGAVGIHPVGSILALALGFQLGGVIGALFAVPLAADRAPADGRTRPPCVAAACSGAGKRRPAEALRLTNRNQTP